MPSTRFNDAPPIEPQPEVDSELLQLSTGPSAPVGERLIATTDPPPYVVTAYRVWPSGLIAIPITACSAGSAFGQPVASDVEPMHGEPGSASRPPAGGAAEAAADQPAAHSMIAAATPIIRLRLRMPPISLACQARYQPLPDPRPDRALTFHSSHGARLCRCPPLDPSVAAGRSRSGAGRAGSSCSRRSPACSRPASPTWGRWAKSTTSASAFAASSGCARTAATRSSPRSRTGTTR